MMMAVNVFRIVLSALLGLLAGQLAMGLWQSRKPLRYSSEPLLALMTVLLLVTASLSQLGRLGEGPSWRLGTLSLVIAIGAIRISVRKR